MRNALQWCSDLVRNAPTDRESMPSQTRALPQIPGLGVRQQPESVWRRNAEWTRIETENGIALIFSFTLRWVKRREQTLDEFVFLTQKREEPDDEVMGNKRIRIPKDDVKEERKEKEGEYKMHVSHSQRFFSSFSHVRLEDDARIQNSRGSNDEMQMKEQNVCCLSGRCSRISSNLQIRDHWSSSALYSCFRAKTITPVCPLWMRTKHKTRSYWVRRLLLWLLSSAKKGVDVGDEDAACCSRWWGNRRIRWQREDWRQRQDQRFRYTEWKKQSERRSDLFLLMLRSCNTQHPRLQQLPV